MRASAPILGCIDRNGEMILIPCPCCGPRDESEFTYGGPRRPFPAISGAADLRDWHEALFDVPNPVGPLVELWYHTSGCETWVEVTRNSRTHEIIGCKLPEPQGAAT